MEVLGLGSMSLARKLLARIVVALAAALVGAAHAGNSTDEYAVKAAMIWNFTKFIQWPASSLGDRSGPFVIGVYGDDPFDGKLEAAVRGKDVDGRPVAVRNFRTSVEGRVHVLFIAESMKSRWRDLGILHGKPILLVGESEGFVKGTGHIAFVNDERRVAFVIGNRAAQSAGLSISSKLLALAKKVDP